MAISAVGLLSKYLHLPWPRPFVSQASIHLQSIDELFSLLGSDNFSIEKFKASKKEIQKLLANEISIENLDRFLTLVLEWGLKRDPQAVFAVLSEIIDLNRLSEVARYKAQQDGFTFISAIEWAKERVDYPKQLNCHSLGDQMRSEWRKYRPLIVYFIPNLINIFLGAFNFLDTHKRFTSLWEKHLILEIVYKFFLIPFVLIQVLNPILVVPAKVYCVAALIIAGVGLLAAAYQRWLRPHPEDIVNCNNASKQADAGFVEPRIGEYKYLNQIFSALLTDSSELKTGVLLVGNSGVGKTSQWQLLNQLKKEGKLPPDLQRLSTYEMRCGDIIGNGTFGHAEMIDQTKSQIEGIEKEVLMFFDEIDQLTINPSCFQNFKQRFVQDKPSPRFIAATTFKGFEKIKEIDVDCSFRHRLEIIVLDSVSDDHNRRMLQELIERNAPEIPITDDAIEEALQCVKDEDFLPHIGSPSKLMKIMKDAIKRCHWAYNPHYVSNELIEAKDQYKNLISQKETPQLVSQRNQFKKKIEKIQADLEEQKRRAQNIKFYMQRQLKMKDSYLKLNQRLAGTRPVSEKAQKLYLLYQFYGIPTFQSLIKQAVEPIKDKLNVQLNKELVQAVFKHLKEVEENLETRNKKESNSALNKSKDSVLKDEFWNDVIKLVQMEQITKEKLAAFKEEIKDKLEKETREQLCQAILLSIQSHFTIQLDESKIRSLLDKYQFIKKDLPTTSTEEESNKEEKAGDAADDKGSSSS